MKLREKIVFITGASSGIGEACAFKLAKEGAKLILCARNIQKLKILKERLEDNYHSDVLVFQVDIRDKDQIRRLFLDLPPEWCGINILVNNAGVASGLDEIHNSSVDDLDDMIDTNIKGLLYVTRAIVPLMLEGGLEAHIINVGSIASTYSYAKGSVYCATKSAVKFISDGLRRELNDRPIKVTNIQPGLVKTNFSMNRFYGDKERAESVYKGIVPLSADDIADVVFFSLTRPHHVQICELTITPLHQAAVDVIFRV